MKKSIIFFILSVLLLLPILSVRAEEETVEQIQTRINVIVDRIKYLRGLLGEDGDNDPTDSLVQNPPAVEAPAGQLSAPISEVINLKYNLSKGKTDKSTAGEVSILQEYLTSEDFYGFPVTGKFDNETYLAVIDFQNEYTKYLGIKQGTGYVGPATRKLIRVLTSGDELDSLLTSSAVHSSAGVGISDVKTVADLPAPSLVFPVGGEKWPLGSYQNIKWSGSASAYDVYVGEQRVASGVSNNNFFWRVGQVGGAMPLQVAQIYPVRICNQGSAKCSTGRSFQITKNTTVISYRISTDKYAYDFNENIKVSIVARNSDPVKKTLNFDTNCQVGYKVYSLDTQKVVYDYSRTRSCAKEYTYIDIEPNGSYSWFIYHDNTRYRLQPGNYVFRAEVDGSTVASTDVTIQR